MWQMVEEVVLGPMEIRVMIGSRIRWQRHNQCFWMIPLVWSHKEGWITVKQETLAMGNNPRLLQWEATMELQGALQQLQWIEAEFMGYQTQVVVVAFWEVSTLIVMQVNQSSILILSFNSSSSSSQTEEGSGAIPLGEKQRMATLVVVQETRLE